MQLEIRICVLIEEKKSPMVLQLLELNQCPSTINLRKSDSWSSKRVAAKSRNAVTKGVGISSVQPVHPRCRNAVLIKQCGLVAEKSVEDMARYTSGLPSDMVYCNKVLQRLKDVVYAVRTDYAWVGRWTDNGRPLHEGDWLLGNTLRQLQ